MAEDIIDESLLEVFIFETTQNIEQLEQLILANEHSESFSAQAVNEIFRIMHTIKGSAAMMGFTSLSVLAHSVEDLFAFIRSQEKYTGAEEVADLVLESIDFVKEKLDQIQSGEKLPEEDGKELRERIESLLERMKSTSSGGAASASDNKQRTSGIAHADHKSYQNHFKAAFRFEEGCGMECIRACNVICRMEEIAGNIRYFPGDIMESDASLSIVKEKGVEFSFDTDQDENQVVHFLSGMPFVCDLKVERQDSAKSVQEPEPVKANPSDEGDKKPAEAKPAASSAPSGTPAATHTSASSMMSVSVAKLDKLMNLMGELVISEAMVIHNPELKNAGLESFPKAARQLKKVTDEMQDMVMSLRMVDLNATFQRMNRIVRDMCKKLDKQVNLELVGADTQVDKSVVEHISDPLMHLVRNAIDHGIESKEERIAKGKPEIGTVTLEARQEGSNVLILVKDDGKGLDRDKILKRAQERGLLKKPVEKMTEKEINSLIFLPGFSTNDNITEFSGRGVGMDVVVKNIESVGGKVSVESKPGRGCVNIMKFPLTLAIIDGMNLRVGKSIYTIPITDIVHSFRPKPEDAITDPNGNEMLMVRGNAYPVVRLYELFGVEPDTKELSEGIVILAESGQETFGILVDELIGQQDVVVKALPAYVKKSKGLAGCTLLGDGQISLILDTGNLL